MNHFRNSEFMTVWNSFFSYQTKLMIINATLHVEVRWTALIILFSGNNYTLSGYLDHILIFIMHDFFHIQIYLLSPLDCFLSNIIQGNFPSIFLKPRLLLGRWKINALFCICDSILNAFTMNLRFFASDSMTLSGIKQRSFPKSML